MSTTSAPKIDLWMDDDELAELELSFARILGRVTRAPGVVRTTFYADFLEVE